MRHGTGAKTMDSLTKLKAAARHGEVPLGFPCSCPRSPGLTFLWLSPYSPSCFSVLFEQALATQFSLSLFLQALAKPCGVESDILLSQDLLTPGQQPMLTNLPQALAAKSPPTLPEQALVTRVWENNARL